MKHLLFILFSSALFLTACDNLDKKEKTLPVSENIEADRIITQHLRQELNDQKELNTEEKNIKIITVNGVVTLKGTVRTRSEKHMIIKLARAIPGVKEVESHIEVSHDKNGVDTDSKTMMEDKE